MTARTDPAKLDNAVSRYLAGESAYKIQTTLGVDRGALRRELVDRGIEPRGRSAAGLNRAASMTADERLAQASAAHAAVRGQALSFEKRCRLALGREAKPRPMSTYESMFADWLTGLGCLYRRELAVGPYNIDFAVGPVAVEILGGEWHAYKVALHAERTPYILNQRWGLAFVWATANCPLRRTAAERVVAFAKDVGRQPTMLGEYRVFRGDGHLIAGGRADDDEFAGIPPARHGENPLRAA